MKHATSIEIVDYRKGKLPSERAQEIEKHLSVCDSCLQAWEELEAVESYLGAWENPPVPETFAVDAIQTIRCKEATPALNLTGDLNNGWRGNLWFRRIVLTVGAVAATLLFQVLVWNPLAPPTTFRAIFNLIPEAFALTSEQAVPDTVLVLILDQGFYLSTPLLTGRYGFDELEDLATELDKLVEKGPFKTLLIVGTDADNPVTFRTDMLLPLIDMLEIDSFSTGTGVVALENREELTAFITLPLLQNVGVFNTSGFITHQSEMILPHPRVGDIEMWLDYNSLLLKPITMEMNKDRGKFRYIPTIRITPNRELVRTYTSQRDSLLFNLLSPSQAILTVNTDGDILIDRVVIPERELERALRSLRLLNPRISLLILVGEDAGPDDPGYRVMRIAKRLGMSVSVRKVREP